MSNSNDRSNHHSQNGSQHSNNGNGKNWSQFGNRSRFPRNSNSRNGSGYSGNSYHSHSQSQESNHSSRSGSQRSSQGGRLYAYRQKSGGDGKLITIPPHHKKNFNKSIGRGKKFDKEREEQEKQQIINDYIQSQKEKGINVNEDTITYEQVCEKMSQSPFAHSQSQQGSTKASQASQASQASNENNNNNNNGIIKNNDIVNNNGSNNSNSNNNPNGGSYRRNNTFSQRSYQSNHSNHSDRSHHSNNSFHRNGSSVRSHQSNNSNHSNGSYKNSPNNQSYFRNNTGNENNNNNNNNINNNTNSSNKNGNNNGDEGYRGGRGRGRGRGRPYQGGNDNNSQRSNDSHHSNGSRFGIGDRNVRFRNSPKSDNSRNNKNNSASPNINNRNNGNNNNDNNGQTTSNIIGNKNNCYFNSNSPPTARNSLNNNNSQNTSQSPMPPNFASPTAQQTTASLLYQPRLIQDSPSEFSRQTALRNMTNLSGTQPSLLMGNSPGPVFTTPQQNQQGQGQARGTPLSSHTAAFNSLGMINPFGGNQQGISSPTNQLSPTFNLSNVNNVQAQRLLGNVTNMANMANMNTVGSMTNTMNGVLPNITPMPGLTSFNNMNMNMNMNGMNFGLLGGNNNNNNNNVNNVQQLLSPTQGVQGSNNFTMTGQLNTNGVNSNVTSGMNNKIVGMASGGLGQTPLIQQPQQQQQGSNVGTNVTNTAETTPNDSAAPVNAHSEEDGFNEEYSHGSYSDRYKSETPQQYHSYRDYAASNRHNNNNVNNGNTNNNNNNSGKIQNGNSSNVNDTSNKHRGSVNGNGDMNRNETESEYIARNNGRLYGDEHNNGLKSKEKDLERYLPKDLLSEMADDSGRSSNGVMNTGNNNSTGRGGLRYKPKCRLSDMNEKRNKDEQDGCGKSVPLIENTQLCNDLKDCLDNNNGDFLIVGIIGKQGVGKSLILSCLASNDASVTSSTSSEIFKVGNIKTFTHGSHVTNGIDAYVSRENIIFLDCEPIFSSSTLSNATQHVEQQMFARDKQGRKRPSYEEFESYDNYGYHGYSHSSNRHTKHEDETAADQAMKIWETEMYKQSVFLASICHVLLVVSDTLNDRKTWDFLRAIYDLRQSLKINSFLKPMRPKYWNLKSSLHDSNNGNHNSNGNNNNNNNSSNGNNGNNDHNNGNEYENNYRISDKMNNILSSENEEYGIHEIMNEAPSRLQAFPDIVFVFNKLESMDMNAATYQDTKRNLFKYFENQRFDIYGEISNPQFVSVIHKNENESKRKVNEKLKYKYASAKIDDMTDRFGDTLTIDDKYDESGKINCFFLPSVNENAQMFFEECDKLREQLLSVSRRLTTKEMSQVEWFDYVTTVWNEIDNSNKISQFRLSNSLTNDDLMKQASSHSGGAPNRHGRRMLH